MQDKLCKAPFKGGNRACRWSQAVAAGSKFVYAAQPDENRVVAIDVELQRVVEVLGTDPLPSSLFYVKSTDQVSKHFSWGVHYWQTINFYSWAGMVYGLSF